MTWKEWKIRIDNDPRWDCFREAMKVFKDHFEEKYKVELDIGDIDKGDISFVRPSFDMQPQVLKQLEEKGLIKLSKDWKGYFGNYEKLESKLCTCPKENFAWNGRGCTCGGK